MTGDSPRLDRRRLLGLGAGAAALAGTGLAGCSGSTAADGPVSIRFAYWGADNRQKITSQVIEAFSAEHPDITVVGEFGPFENYFEKLATQTAGNDTPDVFQMNEKYLTEYADRGVLADLGNIDTSAFAPGTREPGQTEGGLYGLNAGVNAPTIIANPAVFDALGLPLPDDTTWTWEDLADLAVAVTEASGGQKYGIGAMGGSDFAFHVDLRQQGASIFTPEGTLGFTAEQLASWLSANLELQRRRAVPTAAQSAEASGLPANQQPFANQGLAMVVNYTNLINTFDEVSGDDLKLLRFPSRTGRAGDAQLWLRASMFWSGSARSRHPEAVTTFLDFLANSPTAAQILLAERGIPANQTIRDAVSDRLGASDRKSIAYLDAIQPELGAAPPIQPIGGGDFPNVLSRINQEVMFERLGPEEAAARLMTELASTLQ